MRWFFLLHFTCLAVSAEVQEDFVLTWEQVEKHVLSDNPKLKADQWKVEATRAEVLQAGKSPNPSLTAQFENFSGSGDYRGDRSLETTVALSQSIETGGKRGLRKDVATQELKLAETEFATRRTGLLLKARGFFWEILLAQEKISLGEEDLRTAREFLQVQEIRRKAGKSSMLEEERARTSMLGSELAGRRVEREAASLRARLALLMNRDTASFHRVSGDFGELETLPSPDGLYQSLDKNLEKVRALQKLDLRRNETALEKVKAVPDIEVEAGWRRSSEVSAQALVAGVSLPLPLWDRNRGGIAKARAEVSQAREELRTAEGRNKSQLREHYLLLLGLRSDIAFIRDSLLKAASSAFQSAQEGFRLGRFSPLEILDARRSYLDAKQTYLETLAEYHHLRLELEGLITLGTTHEIKQEDGNE